MNDTIHPSAQGAAKMAAMLHVKLWAWRAPPREIESLWSIVKSLIPRRRRPSVQDDFCCTTFKGLR